MKKAILLLLLSGILYSAFGQSFYDDNRLDPTLVKVKNLLEKCLAGTNVRNLESSFKIQSNKNINRYELISDINQMLPETKIALLNIQLNKSLKGQKSLRLEGGVFFDDYLDSALVYVKYFHPDTVYEFISMADPPRPREGYEKFSKDLNDVIKAKIKAGKISKDSLAKVNYIEFNVGRGGMFKRTIQNSLNKELDSFFIAKKSFTNGIFSGRLIEIKVAFVLFKNYLFNDGSWPEQSINNPGYVDYGGEWARVKLITPFDACEETFYSDKLPNQNSELRAVVSMVFDDVLRKYIRPVIHFGDIKETNQLVEDLKSVHRNNLGYIGNRIYFYREK
ncbi:hypothetical protein OC25_22190 [Pedobacter kyungheensis]|uniref:Uncharacterized protein n=1 Tax=Pedobacter kyungheensis TaxID=1069985 RepID=A0A0C1D336_9SPHI|nr:hypothetical protein [Pedobacter kyungheensis]KIA91341.1 hypothetical protein OC25_22190 [Pedobacter kyungheensis]